MLSVRPSKLHVYANKKCRGFLLSRKWGKIHSSSPDCIVTREVMTWNPRKNKKVSSQRMQDVLQTGTTPTALAGIGATQTTNPTQVQRNNHPKEAIIP